jgi:hypothetical protein
VRRERAFQDFTQCAHLQLAKRFQTSDYIGDLVDDGGLENSDGARPQLFDQLPV